MQRYKKLMNNEYFFIILIIREIHIHFVLFLSVCFAKFGRKMRREGKKYTFCTFKNPLRHADTECLLHNCILRAKPLYQ